MYLRRISAIASVCLGIAACEPQGTDTPPEPDPRPFAEVLKAEGLAAAETNLASQPEAPETRFLLGGVRFLRAIEAAMQIRYAHYSPGLRLMPGMAAQLPANPDAQFDPAFLEDAMKAALVHLAEAEKTLKGLGGQDFAVNVQLDDVWFDINKNGARDDWEGVLGILEQFGIGRQPRRPVPVEPGAEPSEQDPPAAFDGVVRFDTADADWLLAYVHVISGVSELTLATDPTPGIRTMFESHQKMAEMAASKAETLPAFEDWPETVGSVILALRGVPDKTRTQAALAHFRAMIRHNLAFWDKVAQETDNDREWLPNANQISAFGVSVPENVAAQWRAVLTDFHAILNGEALLPFWRIQNPQDGPAGVGVNLARLLQDPPDTSLILLVQGASLVPYLEEGPVATSASWDQFMFMTQGGGLLMAAWFN